MIPALTIENLRKSYGNGFEALKGISLEVQQGDFFALLGSNGAGKSTTIGIICSLVSKTGGRVAVYGTDIDQDFPGAKKNIGIVPQEFNFNMFEKVFDIVVNQAGYYGLPLPLAAERAEKYLRELGLWDKRDVDIEMRRSMWDFLKKLNAEGTTIILTTHYLEEAEALCRNIAIINHGEIVEHSSIKELVRRLHREVFILDCVESLPEVVSLEAFTVRRMDEHTLEVEVEKGQTINQVFDLLDDRGIRISSMRNRANRLEEMFVNLVEGAA